MGTFTAAFDLGIVTGSIILGSVLQYFYFRVMYTIEGMIVLAGAVLSIANNERASRQM